MAAKSQSRDEVFNNFGGNMQLVVDKLRENEAPRHLPADFSLAEFWNKLETLVKALSFEATKLATCFSTPPAPSPQECQSLLSSVEMKAIALVSLNYGLPKECGETLRKHTRNVIIGVIENLKELTDHIKKSGYNGSKDQAQLAGAVWASCDVVQSSARNNKEAALKELKSTSGLVRDAMGELEEAKETDGSSSGGFADFLSGGQIEQDDQADEEVWSEQDRAVIHPCLGLANACKACVKKVSEAIKKNGKHKELVHINQLDHVVELSDEISPNLDELVSCLYAPMNYTVVRANASLMAEVLRKLLEFVKESHVVTAEDTQWLEFLTKAIDHNVDLVKNITKEEAPR